MARLMCKRCVERLGGFVAARMAERDRTATRRHVATCKRCGALFRAYVAIPGICRKATDFAIPAHLQLILRRDCRSPIGDPCGPDSGAAGR